MVELGNKPRTIQAVLFVWLLAIPAFAQGSSANDDNAIAAAVERRLADIGVRGVDVSVDGGVVTLGGTVAHVWDKRRAVEGAEETAGVAEVVDNVEVRRVESQRIIGMEVAAGIRNSPNYTMFDYVDIEVEEGVVVLSGRVTMPMKSEEFERHASQVTGVQDVRNQIETLPVSIGDNRLRRELATRILQDPSFMPHTLQGRPSLHIIVENGHVTLAGVVSSEVERVRAAMIARQTFGVMSVENELRVD
jgi:hyperosmotically inducible periplasmic protein